MSASTPEDKAGEGKTQARVDRKLLEILVCPLTKGPLRYNSERNELVSERAGLAYPIRDGIPIMLIDEARRIDDHPPVRGPGAA
jgi:uncharacterized protein YbaR (Trm112 family)